MAISGLIFIAYVLIHMYGNLKVFAGQSSFDEYAHHLREFGAPILPYEGLLWIMRVVLLVAVAVHATAAYKLWARAAAARTHKYVMKKAAVATLSSRTMRWGGTALLLFVVFHILHLTTQTVSFPRDDDSPYQRMVNSFSPDYWWVAVIYLLAMVALAMHLRHGTYSAAQTLGLTSTAASQRTWGGIGLVVAVVVAGGFALVPLSILFGIVE